MKYLFYVWCLTRRVSLEVAMSVWFVYADRRHTPWFKKYLGESLFKLNPIKLLMISPIFDFLSDEGVAYVLSLISKHKPSREGLIELGIFTSEFTRTIGRPYLNGDGIDAYIVASDFGVLRTLYLRNLLPIIAASNTEHEEELVWKELLTYQLTPELAV